MGLKPMKNAEAQEAYYKEVEKLVRDLNLRYLRARVAKPQHGESEALLDRILAERDGRGGAAGRTSSHMPHADFFRRRGVPAFRMVGCRRRDLHRRSRSTSGT